MRKYIVWLAREATENMSIEVDAESADAASSAALAVADKATDTEWEDSDCVGRTYVADVEEL